MRRLYLLALAGLLTASAASAGTVTVSGFSQSAVTTAISSACNGTTAGTVIFPNGTYTITSTVSIPAHCTLQGQNRRGATLQSGSMFAILNINGNSITVDGLVISGGYVNFGGANQYTGFTFTNNTIQNMTAGTTTAGPFALSGPGIKSSLIDSNIFQNLWPGGWPTTPNYSSGNGCTWTGADCWGYGGLTFSSLDLTSITNNLFDKVSMDAIYIDWLSTTGNTGGYTTTNVTIAYNTIIRNRRNPIEMQSQPGGTGCPGGCNFGITNVSNLVVKGNFIHQYSFPFGDNYGVSLVPSGANPASYINNTYVATGDGTHPVSLYADCQETAGDNVLVQGDVCYASVASGKHYNTVYPFGSTAHPTLPVTVQNTIACDVPQYSIFESANGSQHNVIVNQYNYYTTSQCPQGDANIDVSSITPAFTSANNQSFPSGGNGTWNFGVISNFSIKWVQFFIDGSASATQEIQDVNTNFANDRKWLYHLTISTNGLAAGSHTITATATDVSGAAQSATQTFSTGTGGANDTVPNVVGMTQSAATSAITGAGLVLGTVTNQASGTVLAGFLVSSSPAAGSSVAAGSAVNIVVSSGEGTPLAVTCPVTAAPGSTFTCTAAAAVSWTAPSGSSAILTPSTGTSISVTAPSATVYAAHSEGGCPITPNDSVFNTPVTNLPVDANSATWIGSLAATGVTMWPVQSTWEPNVTDDAHIYTVSNPLYFYSTAYNGVPIKIAPYPSVAGIGNPLKKENGTTFGTLPNQTQGFTNDHHLVTIDATNCSVSEVYNNHGPAAIVGTVCDRTTGSTAGCFAPSSWTYPGNGYLQPHANTNDTAGTYGTADAAGLPLEPITLQYDELVAATAAGTAVGHALRFTPAGGYSQAFTSASCPTCQVRWPASYPGGQNPSAAFPPMGGWLRLKSTYTPSGTCGAMCLTILKTLQQHGGIIADNASGFQLNVGTTLWSHSDGAQAASDVAALQIPLSQFDVIDASSLMIDTDTSHGANIPNGYSPWTAANPMNGHVAIPNSMIVCGGSNCVPVSITPVTIGFQEQYHWVVAGSSFTPVLYKNGSSATPVYAVKTCSAGAGNCGTYAAGVYTAPALACGTEQTATITATIGAAVANAYLTLVPAPTALCPLAFDNGGTAVFSGADGTRWLPDTFPRYQQFASTSSSPTFVNGINGIVNADHQLYDTGPYGPSDIVIAPIEGLAAGNYNVTFLQGQGGGGNFGDCDSRQGQWGYSSAQAAMDLEAGGVIDKHNWDPIAQAGHKCLTPVVTTVPMVVGSNGIGSVAVRSSQNPSNNFATTVASVSAIKIVPATSTTPGITIDTEQQLDHVAAGGTLQFYDVPQWIGAAYDSTATVWSLSGPGSVSVNGQYAAPLPPPSPIRLACGSIFASYTNAEGTFTPDAFFSGAGQSSDFSNAAVSLTGLTNPAPEQVYQDSRYGYGVFYYTLANLGPGTTVNMRLHFSDASCTSVGCRTFTVKANGVTELANYDIFASVGQNHGDIKTFSIAADTLGTVTLEFDPGPSNTGSNSAAINGIEAIPVNPTVGFKLTSSATITATNGSYSASKSITVVGPQYPLNH